MPREKKSCFKTHAPESLRLLPLHKMADVRTEFFVKLYIHTPIYGVYFKSDVIIKHVISAKKFYVTRLSVIIQPTTKLI